MKKILFPFELDNPLYKEAYIHGIKLARKMNAELIIFNAFKVEVGDDITRAKYENLKKENWFKAYNEISKFNSYYLQEHVNMSSDLKIKFSYRFIHGIFIDEIRRIANEEEIDLIILPVSDQKAFNKRQLKIIQDNIYENNRASLLAIPFHGVFRPVKTIVFATDLKSHDFRLYLNDVIHYAKLFDSNIHFLHVAPHEKDVRWEGTEEYQMILKIVENNKRHTIRHQYGKDIVETINQYVDSSQADLLVVVKQQHHILDTLFHESVSNQVTFSSKAPVLVMREKRL